MSVISDFIDAMCAAGVRPVEPIEDRLATGQPVRFQAAGDKPGRHSGWAVLHLDGQPAGVFRNYKLDIRLTWKAGGHARQLTPSEQRALWQEIQRSEARRRAETQARQEEARALACRMWREGRPADPAHPYLVRKGLRPFQAIRACGHTLLVPLLDEGGHIWNIQRIYPNGAKRFLKGGRTEGLFWSSAAFADRASPLIIGEGFATMAAIRQATGYAIVAALSARNLEAVARTMRRLFSARPIIIAADDDAHLPENIGLNAARKAAKVIGAGLAVPRSSTPDRSPAGSGIDFADLCAADIIACFKNTRRPYHG
jgi:putative DNA primase/helicase